MAVARVIIAVGLLASLAAGGVALASWGHLPFLGGSGAFDVAILGPQAAPLFHGPVRAENATALSLLTVAATSANLTVETQAYPGMGTYVRGVGGYEAHGAAGWIYEVRRSDAWVSGDRAADRYPVHAGEALRWSWTEGS